MAIRDLMMDLTDGKVDVFNCITLASVTMSTFRHLFMTERYELKLTHTDDPVQALRKGSNFYHCNKDGQPDMNHVIDPTEIESKTFLASPIPQAPITGYTGRGDNYSKVSLEWLKWVEQELGRPIQTALSDDGEKQIRVGDRLYRVDGYDEQTGTIYEFHG